MKTRNHNRSAEHKVKTERAPGLNNPQGGETFDIYQQVTNQIIEAMETSQGQGRRLWDSQPSLPLNLSTGKPYSGMNILILWSASLSHGYRSPYWLTYKQAEAMGGQVRKGEHGTACVFYKPWESQETNSETGETETKTGAVLKSFRVFNLDQVDGIEAPATEARAPFEVLADAERLLQHTPAPIIEGGHQACYIPSRDEIRLPARETFINPEAFYSTACHEMTHASGHKSRLDRNLSGRFGDEAYAMEELVAELGAAFLCAEVGILPATRADHAHYLANWVRVLRSDRKAIFTAAAAASKAAAYIKGHAEARTEAA
ncbi:ssDNA-binding domain-containing protein [Acidiferrobacter thiooxydans]|uniref:ArdC family protein n=1 Tax=Acidiferrobacter thiooxydans TaxID=163359 RepID=UPI0009FE27DB|nr:zincin-like metallopeptidase domain-containing protein [Acidiferrobacter thiooxydans]UEO00479.1 ssDNA-binding domain-containing protein [Acidiferrobacter thiooxydans]